MISRDRFVAPPLAASSAAAHGGRGAARGPGRGDEREERQELEGEELWRVEAVDGAQAAW
jgi:hypothetical protein